MEKLVIHIDLRNTTLVADTFTNTGVETCLASYLSSVAWGSVDSKDGTWRMTHDVLSLKQPENGLISFYNHIEMQARDTAVDRIKIRELTGKFVESDSGVKVRQIYKKLLDKLQWQHKDTRWTQFFIEGESRVKYHFILPSLYYLLRHLVVKNVNFSLVIRTFGMDCPQALECVQLFLQNRHPMYKINTRREISVNRKPFHIRRSSSPHKIKLLDSEGETICRNTGEFYNWTVLTEGITGIVDEYSTWELSGYSLNWGKPFFVSDRDKIKQVIFDDNARPCDEHSIVNLIKHDENEFRDLNVEEGFQYFEKNVFQVDLIAAILNDLYFVNKLSL
ncbi:uncharacterized protein LOC115231742 [Octopus sinensis]|uniref:Uncharacterized protein LOC115231742 n=1 Tax=Octopus sinensis TaxID=2607531 RepID=A0A6P7U841_9MOLL|nr:uncharacterized protein LOC115231742 [Octopus sinensis]